MVMTERDLDHIKEMGKKQQQEYKDAHLVKPGDDIIVPSTEGVWLCKLVEEICKLKEEALKWCKPTDKENNIRSVRVHMRDYGKYGKVRFNSEWGGIIISPLAGSIHPAPKGEDSRNDHILVKAIIYDLQQIFKDNDEIVIRRISEDRHEWLIQSLSDISNKLLHYEIDHLESKYLLDEPTYHFGGNVEAVMNV